MSRDAVVRLGRTAPPWDFLPVVLQVFRAAPRDAELRLLASAACLRIGLKTLGLEQLDAIGAADAAELRDLRRSLDALPDDRVEPAARANVCSANVGALFDRGVDLRTEFAAWRAASAGWQVFRDRHGNVIRRRIGEKDPAAWIGLGDQQHAAREFAARFLAAEDTPSSPHYVEGIDPPWLFRLVYQKTGASADGHRTLIRLAQADTMEFLDGLACADLREELGDPRVRVFVGAGAGVRLLEEMRAAAATRLVGPFIPLRSVRTRIEPPMERIVRQGLEEQAAAVADAGRRVEAIYAGRDRAWWAGRYERAMVAADDGRTKRMDGKEEPTRSVGPPQRRAGTPPHSAQTEGGPLRVLIPTCRYTTYVQHACRDLAEVFRRAGCEAEVLIEPDEFSHFSALAYHAAFERFRPDLVVLINYTRWHLNGSGRFEGPGPIPANVPYVCWVQDAMPHLFDGRAGAAEGELDFLAGNLFPELFEAHGYPRGRCLASTVTADTRKFHTAPVHADARARFECEIAYVSHQSETTDALHERLRAEFADALGVRRAVDELRPVLERETLRPLNLAEPIVVRELAREALERELGRTIGSGSSGEPANADGRLLDVLTRNYAQPYADRLIRHQTLTWAAEAAERRGWRLRLYGRGWERHPRFAAFAAGELAHGEDLRASYQCAAVHLHMTCHSLVHQRLLECVLSGGFPLCRITHAERTELFAWLMHRAIKDGARPMASLLPWAGRQIVSFAESPAMTMLASILGRWGLLEHFTLPIDGARPGWIFREADFGPMRDGAPPIAEPTPERHCAFWMLAESPDNFCHDAASLEERVQTALDRPTLRGALSAAASRRATAKLSTDALAAGMLAMVATGLGAGVGRA